MPAFVGEPMNMQKERKMLPFDGEKEKVALRIEICTNTIKYTHIKQKTRQYSNIDEERTE